jgi:glutamyl-tRNA reductase
MPLLVAGLNHRTAPIEMRERFAFAEAALPEALTRLRSGGLAEEAVIVSTCNRVEIYAWSAAEAASGLDRLRQFLTEHGGGRIWLGQEVYGWSEPQSVEHLFRVVSGLDSMVLGETEVLGQVKKAYDIALRHRHTGWRLNKVFQRAFNVAKQIRTETFIQRGSVSVGSVAVDLAEKIFDALGGCSVLVLGAGDTSEKAARAFLSRGAREVVVSNRTLARAELLASELGGRSVPFDRWSEAAEAVDILLSSTAASEYLVNTAGLESIMKRRQYRPLLLVDIAVPRNIDPAVSYLENVYLYNVDDLQAIADDCMQRRREELHHCETIIRDRAAALLADPRRHPWVSQARQQPLDSRV